jgi:cobalt transporter subunit CbtB
MRRIAVVNVLVPFCGPGVTGNGLTARVRSGIRGASGASHGPQGRKLKREHGADDPIGAKTVTAPATVSGEDVAYVTGVLAPGRRLIRPSRKSGDLPDETPGESPKFIGRTEGDMTTATQTLSLSFPQRIAIGMSALFLGSFLVFGVGLANDARLHNAAHDTRHAVGFPCH